MNLPNNESKNHCHTCNSLRLNLEEAMNGRTWLLLPEGFRAEEFGKTYPLPTRRLEIQKLITIPIPQFKHDSGCIYLKRALKKWKAVAAKANSALIDVGRRAQSSMRVQDNYRAVIKGLKAEAREAVEEVKKEAAEAIASMTDLFSLGRKGLDAQMRAHLANSMWNGETIDARAFRECFRMVTQAVKGLGLPSSERAKATEAIMEEAAAALKDTQETVALASDPENDKVDP